MKKVFSLICTLLIFQVLFISLPGCDDEESDQDRIKGLLSKEGSWNLESAVVAGVDQTITYEGLVLTFTASDFTTTNGGVIWPASGTWRFEKGSSTTIVRDDGLVVEIGNISKKNMALNFTWDKNTFEQGRIKSVSGDHTFTFTRP